MSQVDQLLERLDSDGRRRHSGDNRINYPPRDFDARDAIIHHLAERLKASCRVVVPDFVAVFEANGKRVWVEAPIFKQLSQQG